MEKAKDGICPRCLGDVPAEGKKGAYLGALSRVADVEICSLCGEDEAVASLFTGGKFDGLVPQNEWPIDRAAMVARLAPLTEATKKVRERGPAALEERFRFGVSR